MVELSVSQLAGFLLAAALITLAPGPDNLSVLSLGLSRGRHAGIGFGLGCALGCFTHTVWATLGVTALIAASETAFLALKMAGAAYLVWIGIRMLLSKATQSPIGQASAVSVTELAPAPARAGAVFMGGFWTNVLNPKVAIFFLAFVPQFIAPATQNKALAFVLLGVLFNVNAIPVNALWALAASWMARRVGAVQKGMHWLDRVAGAMFIGFGLKLAFTEQPSA